jgi:hypothetical protein
MSHARRRNYLPRDVWLKATECLVMAKSPQVSTPHWPVSLRTSGQSLAITTDHARHSQQGDSKCDKATLRRDRQERDKVNALTYSRGFVD